MKCIFFFDKNFTSSTQHGHWHGQPLSHLCGWKSIYFSTITIAAVVVCLSFFFFWKADCGSEWVFHEMVCTLYVTCTRKGLTSANLNGRFEMTEKAKHERSTLTWLCALLCIVFPLFLYMYIILALVLPHWRKYLGFIKYTHVENYDARSRASKSHKSKHTEFIL